MALFTTESGRLSIFPVSETRTDRGFPSTRIELTVGTVSNFGNSEVTSSVHPTIIKHRAINNPLIISNYNKSNQIRESIGLNNHIVIAQPKA